MPRANLWGELTAPAEIAGKLRELSPDVQGLESFHRELERISETRMYGRVAAVVGMLVETGYRGYQAHLDARGILPGMRVALAHLQQDASRHLELSVVQLAILAREHGGAVPEAIERRASELRGPALDLLREVLRGVDGDPSASSGSDLESDAVALFRSRCRQALG